MLELQAGTGPFSPFNRYFSYLTQECPVSVGDLPFGRSPLAKPCSLLFWSNQFSPVYNVVNNNQES